VTTDLFHLASLLREENLEDRLMKVLRENYDEIARAIEEKGEYVFDADHGIKITKEDIQKYAA
jgi:hypothetical protein